MKRLLKNILPLLVILPMIFSSFPTQKASAYVYVPDQGCENANITAANQYWMILSHNYLIQTFSPSLNRLTSIELAIAGGADVNAPITLGLYTEGGIPVTLKTVTTEFAQVSWVTFAFDSPITLDTTKHYQIDITTTSSTARWIVSTVPCYSGGIAYVENFAENDQDFGFFTYGYNYVAPATVAKPTSVTASYILADNRVKLTWVKSTTSGVQGYKIYRSTHKTTGFTEVAKVSENTVKYNDTSGIVPGTFYYYIQAFKGTVKSQPSPTLTVVVPKPVVKETNTTPTKTTTTSTTPTDQQLIDSIKNDTGKTGFDITSFVSQLMGPYIPFVFIIGGCIVLGVIILIVLIASKKKQPTK